MNKIQWGIIGCGGIARKRMLPGFLQAENACCAAVMARTAATVEAVSEEFGVQMAFTDAAALLTRPEIDAVYIASPVDAHLEQVMAAADAGKHILLEKPMGLTAQEAAEMVHYCREKGVKLGVGFVMRFHSAHQLARDLVRKGTLGQVVSARAILNFDYPAQPGNWRQTKATGGGGAMMDVGIHCIDTLRYITGLEANSVAAFCGNQVHSYPDVEDACTAVLKMDNGSFFTVEAGFQLPSAVRGSGFEICGTKGRLVADGTLGQTETGTLRLHRADGTVEEQHYESGNLYTKQIEAFSQAVLDGVEAPISGEEGWKDQLAVDAAYESNITGRHICLY